MLKTKVLKYLSGLGLAASQDASFSLPFLCQSVEDTRVRTPSLTSLSWQSLLTKVLR